MPAGYAMRTVAREIFQYALTESSIEKAFSRHLSYERGVLRVCEDLYDITSHSRVLVVSFGKAGHRMAEALSAHMGATAAGIVADPNPPAHQLSGYRYFAGSHPYPNAESVLGAEAILKTLRRLGSGSLVLFLISGGGSSVVETPIDPEISLEDLITTYRALVHSGAPIAQINTIRKHLSAAKGGRMAKAAAEAQQVSILISDVPENSLDALSSGPTMRTSRSFRMRVRVATSRPYSCRKKCSTRPGAAAGPGRPPGWGSSLRRPPSPGSRFARPASASASPSRPRSRAPSSRR